MSGWELLGGISNILQIIGTILQLAKGYKNLRPILEEAFSKAKRIEANIRQFDYLHTLDGVQSNILHTAVQDFNEIELELTDVREKVSHRSTARTFLSSPDIERTLRDISSRLSTKDDIIQLIGMIGAMNVEQRSHYANLVSLLSKRELNEFDTSFIRRMLSGFCPTKLIEENVRDIIRAEKRLTFPQTSGHMHLSTGLCLFQGKFGVKNYEEAALHFNAAINAGKSEAYYFLGYQYKHGLGVEKCGITAKDMFQRGTDAGNVASMTQLGACYDMAIGVEKDSQKGREYFKRASEAGDPNGMCYYAYYKLTGDKTDVNPSLAYRLASSAASKVRNGRAQDILGWCYEKGIGVERNPTEAYNKYKEAVDEGGSWIANLPLARCYEQGIGIEVDLRKAAELYQRGTELAPSLRPFFQAYYGMCLIRGHGAPEDRKNGWVEVQKSIQANNGIGWYVKGECHRLGYGVPTDLREAARCYQSAIKMESGHDGKIKSRFTLGCMYEQGVGGLTRDLRKAFGHFNFAANRMHQGAQWKVAVFSESGKGADLLLDRAVHYFRLAANSGHREGQLKASKYYMKGKGISRDLHTAVQILQPAADNGDRKARRLLHRAQLQLLLRRNSHYRTRSEPSRSQ